MSNELFELRYTMLIDNRNNEKNPYLLAGATVGIISGSSIGAMLENTSIGAAIGLLLGIIWAVIMDSFKPERIKNNPRRRQRK